MLGSGLGSRSRSFYFFFLTLALGLTFNFIAFAQEWQELKGDHFVVYYEKQDKVFAADVLRRSEYYYKDIADSLGYARYSNFWQWDNRVKIYLYPDKNSFLCTTGQPSWSSGSANYTTKQIVSYSGSAEFLRSILPHEIAHLIFRDFVGFLGEVPLWLDEGVAQWQEEEKRKLAKYYVRALFEEKKLMPLDKLTSLDVRRVQDGEEAKNFYIQAVSLVGFMVEKYGADGFAHFCRQLRDGKSLDDALRFSYPANIRSLGDLENKWLEYVSKIKIKVQIKSSTGYKTVSF